MSEILLNRISENRTEIAAPFIFLNQGRIFQSFTLRTNVSSNHNYCATTDIRAPQQQQHQSQWLTTTLCVSQQQVLFDKRDATYPKDNIWQTIADHLDCLLFCLLRWSLELSHRHPKMSLESAVFQLYYEVLLLFLRFSWNLCHGQCKEIWSEHFTSEHFTLFMCTYRETVWEPGYDQTWLWLSILNQRI